MYFDIALIHLIVLGTLWVLSMVIQVIYLAWEWMNDKNKNNYSDSWLNVATAGVIDWDNEDHWLFCGLLGITIVLIAFIAWLVVYPALIIAGIMFIGRGALRFKTKVNKAIEKK
jgi:hypothetical protein